MNRKRSFFKKHRNCLELGTDNSQYGGYISRLWNWMNSYWMFWIDGLSRRFSASSFCDFWKVTCFSPFWQKQPFNFSDVRHRENLIYISIAYLCLNMINFDAVDFSERRSEEVISFFWRSVYVIFIMNDIQKSDDLDLSDPYRRVRRRPTASNWTQDTMVR